MPFAFAEHPYPNQVLVIVSGETSMDEMMNFIVTTRTGNQREVAFLFEVSGAAISLSSDEVRMLATYAADEERKSPIGPVAFISTDAVGFGMSRMYQSYSAAAGRHNVGVFRTLTDAQAWLAGLSTQGLST